MWAWIVGLLGVGGLVTAALVFAASWFPVLAPFAAIITGFAKTTWRVLTAAFVWSWRQAVAAPAWTAVLVVLVVLAWIWSGNTGYGRGDTAGYARASADLKQARANEEKYRNGLNTCNASVLDLKAKGDRATDDANRKIAALEGQNKALTGNIAAMKAIRSTGEKCPVAGQIMLRAFQ